MPTLALLILAVLTVQPVSSTLFPHSNVTAQRNAARASCNDLESILGFPLVQSSGTEYDASVANAWNLQNAEYQPTCIVFPRTSEHVQTAMKAIYEAGSQYAVQAGSHSAMKGWNTVQDGVLILFSHMKNVSYDPVRDSITLEPGIHWLEAVAALEPQGVAPVGGRVGDVGTGLLLGGGLSWLSPSHGYAADTIKELDVILVTGELVTATATNAYSDLFRALKGGGNRFGIVTRYEVEAVHTGTHEDKAYFGGLMIYNSSAEALLHATAEYVRNVKDPKAVLLASFINTIQAGVISPVYLISAFYHGPKLPTAIFGKFLSIPAMSSQLGPLSYLEVSETLGVSPSERGFIQHFGASALLGEEDLFLAAFNHWSDFTKSYSNYFSATTLAFTPIPDSQIRAGRAKGGNIINPPSGGFAAVQIYETFNDGIEQIPQNVQKSIDALFAKIPPSPGLPLYLNECDEKQKVFASYGDFELMKRIYAKYDPSRFNVQHSRGPVGL